MVTLNKFTAGTNFREFSETDPTRFREFSEAVKLFRESCAAIPDSPEFFAATTRRPKGKASRGS